MISGLNASLLQTPGYAFSANLILLL